MVLEGEQDHVQETCEFLQARIAAATAQGAATPAAGRLVALSVLGYPETGSTCSPCQPGPCIGMLWRHGFQAAARVCINQWLISCAVKGTPSCAPSAQLWYSIAVAYTLFAAVVSAGSGVVAIRPRQRPVVPIHGTCALGLGPCNQLLVQVGSN
jgi:hypothetical protein